jgi:hypothetical protein
MNLFQNLQQHSDDKIYDYYSKALVFKICVGEREEKG